MHDFNLPYKFSEEVEKETEKLNDIISEKEIGKRKDLRKEISFTMILMTQKIDDALSIKINNDLYEIGITLLTYLILIKRFNK